MTFDPLTGNTCGCPLCTDGPLEKACAVTWAIVVLGGESNRLEHTGATIAPDDRDALIAKVWRLLERGGFTPAEARSLVVDLKDTP